MRLISRASLAEKREYFVGFSDGQGACYQ